MGHKKNHDRLHTRRQLDRLKWETARELGLEEGFLTDEIFHC